MRRSPFLLLLLLVAASPRVAATDRESELEDLRRQIERLEQQLEALAGRRRDLIGDIESVELTLTLQERRVREAARAGELAAEALADSTREVESLERTVERQRQLLKSRVGHLYRLGRGGYLRVLLAVRAQEDLLPALRQLRFLARRDSRDLLRYLETSRQLERRRRLLEERRSAAETWHRRERERRALLLVARRQQEALLERLEAESLTVEGRVEALGDKERKLSSLLDFLYGRAGAPLSGEPIQRFRGALEWPVEGTLAVGFGPRVDRRYRTSVPHNGLDISTRGGSEVRSIYPGRVLFAAPFQGYGLTAIVHHPGRVFSLYAGLEELRVGRDDMLSLDQVIGLASDVLYFEIRVENSPVDPVSWLR